MQEMFDLHERGYIDVSDDLLDEDRIDEYRALIAQRAYDLVKFILENTNASIIEPAQMEFDRMVTGIPDLTEWPTPPET